MEQHLPEENNLEQQEITTQLIGDRKKQLVIIGAIASAIVILILLSLTLTLKKPSPPITQQAQKEQQIEQKGSIAINPSAATLPDNSAKQTFYIDFDAQDAPVNTVEFKVVYETPAINEFNISRFMDTSSALSQSLDLVENTVDPKKGIATMKFQLKKGSFAQKGKARLAEITLSTSKILSFTPIEFYDVRFTTSGPSASYQPSITNLRITASQK